MAIVIIDDNILIDIANVVREKTNNSDKLSLSDISARIADIDTNTNSFDISTYQDIIQRTISDISIPADITTLPQYFFAGCTELENVSLPTAMVLIYPGMFLDCNKLTNINTEHVRAISESGFSGCIGLVDIDLSNLVTAGNYAFKNCTGLVSIEIPKVTKIPTNMFLDCTNLKNITIADDLISIDNYAFKNCTSLTSIELPDTITSIGNYVFENCSSLTSIELPDNVTSIGSYIFKKCTNLVSAKVPLLSGNMFNECTNLKEIIVTGTDITIGDYACYNCNSLEKITMNTIYRIWRDSFHNCTNLKEIVVRFSGVISNSIESRAFCNCTGLKTVTILNHSGPQIASDAFSGCTQSDLVINVPWAQGEVKYAPWGATNATINYNYTEDTE